MKTFFRKLGMTSLCVITYPFYLALRNKSKKDEKNFFQNIKEAWKVL